MNDSLPRAEWLGVIWKTLLIVSLSTIASALAAATIMYRFSEGLNAAGLATSIVLPILIGGPLSVWHLILLARLRLANQRLQVLASTDWLTSCLNRRAFTGLVADQLQDGGALLVIDADHFKQINDRHGHDRGDEVLRLIARTIRSNVRDGDMVGRIGGEEFGVFLLGADHDTAITLAERIRNAVQQVRYAPDGEEIPISVSVGGASFDGEIAFSHLFRVADQRLYGVKQTGRNQTDLVRADIGHESIRSAAAA